MLMKTLFFLFKIQEIPLVILMEKFLGLYYSKEDLRILEDILKSPPLLTTLRVNRLKCTKYEAKEMLCNHFKFVNEPFLVEENEDFPDVLIVKSIGPNVVTPVTKGT